MGEARNVQPILQQSVCLSLVHWNVNGRTSSNCKIRTLLLQSLDPDISLNETHLSGDDIIELSGYLWFGNNRNKHIRGCKEWRVELGSWLKTLFGNILK